MSLSMIRSRRVVEVVLHIFVDPIDLAESLDRLDCDRTDLTYSARSFDKYCRFLWYVDNEMLIYASNQRRHALYY